ncbi:hypothetical protein Pan216_22720 [Planctomycetes bacterium Pan216]|uniref:VWFA domain-containing protein n=1 Tax=Kolteria novifilia TaxID=2527975 RepID=A0A518B3B5_9BACT|nr:hypothetical protein Pan216_22720 [Planctomycetes bacterium Pan216]
MALFGSDFLRKLEYLSLVSRRTFRGQLLAQRRTMQHGGGIEFSDHRDYAPGDDFRHLDWNVFARHDELLLKRFQQEEDLHVYLLLDASKSMGFGNPPKFDLARRLAAALAYIALADLDRIALTVFADTIVDDFPLARGKARILTLMAFLEGLELRGRDTDLRGVVRSFVHRSQRRGLAIVISDLFDPKGYAGGIDLLRHHGYEPHLLQLHDHTEANPTMLGDVELEDIENGSVRKVTVTEANLRHYRQLFEDFQKGVDDYSHRYGIGHTRSTADVPFDDLILRMMRAQGAVR